MKKLLSLVLACIVGVVSISSPVYADEVSTDYSSQNVPEGYLGMILDEYGNITELIPMPNAKQSPYVDNIYTLKPKGAFVSHQYYVVHDFCIGFMFFKAD